MKRGRSFGSRLLAGTILVTLAALPRPAWAQLIWDGSVSADWFDAQNWNLNRQPAPTDPVVIDTTTPNATLFSAGTASVLDLIVGATNGGGGNLTIQNGGALSSGSVVIGAAAGSNGYARLAGENSLWTVTGPSFVVGDAGTGTLNLWNLSHLDFAGGTIDVARQAGSTGTIIFGPDPDFVPPPGQGLNVRAGTLDAAAIRFGAGNGTLLFNGSATGGTVLAPVLIGNGQLVLPENRLILNTNSPDFTGHAAIGLGHLVVNGFLPNMTVGVNQTPPAPASFGGGILSGVGTVGSTVLRPGGDLAPGDPDRRGTAAGVGTLTVNGSLTFNPSANPQFGYFADIAPTAADRVVVAGTASIVGELFVFGTGGDYVAGQQYTLLSAGSPLAGQFRTFSVSGDFGGLRASLSYDANNAYLDLTDYASGTDARWLANPGSGNWHTPGNWDPAAVPNGTATFGASTQTTIDFTSGMTGIQASHFEAGAPVYTFNIANVIPAGGAAGSDYIDILGAGIVNDSSSRPIFFVSPQTGNAVHFRNASSADDAILNAGVYFEGGYPYTFHDESTAADATIATLGGFSTAFRDDSTAANARFEAGALELGSSIGFFDRSSAGTATFDTGPTGGVVFSDRSTAAAAEIVSRSSNASLIDPDATANVFAGVAFRELSTAGTATISNVEGGTTEFRDTASAASATIINTGTPWYQRTLAFWDASTAADATITNDSDGSTQFFGDSSAANATIVNNDDGETFFSERATAATATIVNNAGGRVQISALTGPSITIGTLSGAGDIYLGDSNLRLAGLGGDATIGGVIADGGVLGPNSEFPSGEVGGSLTWAGAATLTLTGSNTYTGGTTLAGGTLRIGHSNALGTGALTTTGSVVDYADGVTVANPIVLNSNDTRLEVTAGTATQAGVISETGGARPLEKIGVGTLILSADNTYTGTTTISAGTLQLGDGGGTGAILGNIANNAALVVDRTGTLTLGGVISGSGTLDKRGAGTLILDGSNTYIGLTRPRAGTLLVNGTIGEVFADSGTTIGAILGGTGTVGKVDVSNLFIAPGSGGIGTLTSTGRVDFRSGGGMFSEVAPNTADRLDIAQTAFINGTLHLVATGGNYAAGTQYTLLDAAGGIVPNSFGNGLVFDNVSMQGSFSGLAPTISYTNNSVILTLVDDGRTEWRGMQSTDWFTPANWLDNAVPTSTTPTYINTISPNPTVISGGTAASGELFIGSNPTETGNLTIQNGGILATTGAAHLGLGNFTNVLEPGVGAVLVSGAGSAWIVSGALNLGGNTAANENVGVGTGRLRIEDGASVTSNGATVFSTEIGFGGADSTVLVTGTGSVWNSGDLGVSTTGGFTTDRLTIENGGTVNSLSTTASGRLLVTGAGSVWNSGPLTLGGGNLRVESGGRVNTAGDGILAGTFFNNSARVTGAGSVWDITGSLRISQSSLFEAGTVTIADGGTISVGGGAGTVFLGTANALPILNIGASAAPGTLNAAEVVTAGQSSVVFNHTSQDYLFAPRISGDGAIGGSAVFVNGGTTIFTADHTYTGGTSIDGGTLQLGNGGSTGSIVGDIAIGANATLNINRTGTVTLAGEISGTGGISQFNNALTTILTGNSPNFTGGIALGRGTLLANGSIPGARVVVGANGTLSGTGTVGATEVFGFIAPGAAETASVGTLTVQTSLRLERTYIVDVTPVTADLVTVNGTATLGGQFFATDLGGTYFNGQQFIVLTASGGIAGAFDTFSTNPGTFGGLQTALSYTNNSVILNVGTSTPGGPAVWDGLQSTDWFTAANWISNAVPTVADEVTINTATPNRTVIDRMGAASADILIGTAAGATGNLAIDGTLSSDGDARVGANGGSGTVLVSGSGSSWLISGELALALQGGTSAGSVTVRDGASLVNSGTTVGGIAGGPAGPTGVGTIVVTGGGTTWNSGAVLIGSRGLLTISDGAAVTSSGVSIHNDTAVTGPGTVWTTGDLSVLDGIDGALTIADGAVVNSGDVGLGPAPDLGGGGASQVVTVTGAGTTWNIAGDLRIGNPLQQAMSNDIAYFHIVDNAIVDVGGGTGTVYVGVGGSLPDLLILGDALSQNRPGTLNAARVEVGAGSSINFRSVAGTPYIFAPAIGGEGDIVAFSGTTVLTADSGLFSGTTTIDSGATLQLGNGASTGALGGTIALGDDSTLAVNRTGTLALGGVISGTGGFAQRGSVVTRMTATNTYTGGTVVNGGTLLVDGSIAGSAVSVNDTGVLGGAGAVGATTIATGGTLAPGNSIGMLNIVGNLSFAAGSFLQVEANAAGQADRIALTGAATISGGTVNVLAAAGNYAPSTVYTILSAIGGVTGTFSDVTSNLAFLTPELGYGANAVTLTLTRNAVSFCSVGDTFNQCSTGGAIELLGTGNSVFDGVVRLDAATARDAFDQLSGEAHATLAGVLVEDGRFVRDAATNRVRAAFGDHPDEMPLMAYDGRGAMPGSDADRSAAWVHTFGSRRDRDGDTNAAALERSTGGILFGVDGVVAEDVRIGVLGGFANTSFNVPARNSAGSVESWHLGFFGGGHVGAIGLSAGAAYSWHGIETTRLVAFPGFTDRFSADYGASTLQVFGEASHAFAIGDATIEPFAGLAHVRLSTDGFTETGGAGALTVAASSTDVTFSTIGLRGDIPLKLQGIDARATGMVGWRHAFGDVVPTASPAFAGGGAYPVLGLPIARDSAVVEAGLDLDFSPRSTLGISYSGQFGSGAFEHGARASFSLRF